MRIASIRRVTLQHPVPVGDMSVSRTECFELSAGPIVHNSKDCSDAVAGVVEGLGRLSAHIPIPMLLGNAAQASAEDDGGWVLNGKSRPVSGPGVKKNSGSPTKLPPLPFSMG